MEMISVGDLEDKIFRLEEIRVVVRASKLAKVNDYEFERKAPRDMTLKEWAEKRLKPCIGYLSFEILSGDGQISHSPATVIETIRSGYNLDLPAFKYNKKPDESKIKAR